MVEFFYLDSFGTLDVREVAIVTENSGLILANFLNTDPVDGFFMY